MNVRNSLRQYTLRAVVCPTILVFGKKASWMFFFQTILTNPIILQIQFFMMSHFSTLLSSKINVTVNHINIVEPFILCFTTRPIFLKAA